MGFNSFFFFSYFLNPTCVAPPASYINCNSRGEREENLNKRKRARPIYKFCTKKKGNKSGF